MPTQVMVTVYTIVEVQAELVQKGKAYSKKRVYDLVNRYYQDRGYDNQGKMLLTRDEIEQVFESIRPAGRPRKA